MPALPLRFALPLIAFFLVTLGLGFSQNPTEPQSIVGGSRVAAKTAAIPNSANLVIGQGGCAATGCHGRPEVNPEQIPNDVWHESFTRWIDADPHRKAYAVLEGELGRAISKRLHEGDPTIPEIGTRDSRCLACHTNPTLAHNAADRSLDLVRAEGVSCEACHGSAGKWQISHIGWSDPAKRTDLMQQHGMRELNDWQNRARMCVGCHIGAPAGDGYPVRDMNHDMIAAGHPRLEFDFATFFNKLPKHWNERHRGTKESDPGALRPILGWYVGQLAVEEASCQLLEDRVARAGNDSRSIWPEFAEWNCSQCHHNLQPAEWRAAATASQRDQRKLGQPVWLGLSPLLGLDRTTQPMFSDSVATLKQKSAQRRAALQNPGNRAQWMGEVAKWLDGAEQRNASTHGNWEEAVRLTNGYLSLDAAIHESRLQMKLPETSSALRGDLKKLLFGVDRPLRREGADIRKPDSRWNWESGKTPRATDLSVLRNAPKMLAAELKQLQAEKPRGSE